MQGGEQRRRLGSLPGVDGLQDGGGPLGAGHDHGVGDTGARAQGLLDLAQFDVVAADLDLVVEAAEMDEGVAAVAAHPVSGPVPVGAGQRSRRRG
ncbi:hypothetical protein [Streptomyces sp. NPDC017673]|uniref:hypothetical protein n=1 Tax=unclassified Streptomyces TaxID=2593676 RepID=UPI0037BAD256